MDVSYQKPRSSEDSDVSLVTWKLNNKGMSSEAALKQVEMLYDDMDIESKVIEQNWNGLEYHAIVEVVTDDEVCCFCSHAFMGCLTLTIIPYQFLTDLNRTNFCMH